MPPWVRGRQGSRRGLAGGRAPEKGLPALATAPQEGTVGGAGAEAGGWGGQVGATGRLEVYVCPRWPL